MTWKTRSLSIAVFCGIDQPSTETVAHGLPPDSMAGGSRKANLSKNFEFFCATMSTMRSEYISAMAAVPL